MEKQNLTQKEALEMLKNMDINFSEQSLVFYTQEEDLNKVELLLIAGVNPNSSLVDGNKFAHYPMHKAAIKGNVKMLELLLIYGADINKKLNSETTALMYAVNENKPEAVKFLIEKGADTNAKNSLKLNALYSAKKNKNEEIIKMLKDAGAEEIKEEEEKAIETDIKTTAKKNKMVSTVSVVVLLAGCIWIAQLCSNHKSPSSSSGGSSASVSHTCLNCGKAYSGYGYATANGEEYALTSDGGNQYCSSSCAKASRPRKWR